MADQSFSSSFSELLATARGHFTWPQDATLYCLPPDCELLPDTIRRLCFQTYLKLCNLSYGTVTASNADAMSPNGLAPFLTVSIGNHLSIFSDFDKLVVFLEAQSLGLDSGLKLTEKADNHAFISVVKTRMEPAEVQQTWTCPANSNQAHSSGRAWPLNRLLPWACHLHFIWNNWSLYTAKEDRVLLDYEGACKALQTRLRDEDTFFAGGPTSLDILVFSHVHAAMTTPLPNNKLCAIVRRHQKLVQFSHTLSARHSLT